ncbi:hypothetical protein ACLQ3D_02255 [Micromonospora vinacea]|uniref:Secreted protein/lipoprotein n=1 Tax=Micromonospora vinacea TaxID=709878 RepID=A0ABS0JZ73_9ACTN|nr:hypothetical protein [Micromonospora vinacea]MBG6101669.1 hypothetical protein [Micromonospora vinacea]WSZ75504.1 hypothetical protein OH804_26860 [Micromonospora sp. NBC_00860]WTA68012.1 hypothetical protein OHB51_02215 [Micromonospora sp. NBC_00855]
MRGRQLRRAAICLLAAVAAMPVTACASGRETVERPTAARDNEQRTDPDVERRAAEKAALDAYSGYLAASRTAGVRSDPRAPELTRFLADPLLTRVQLSIRDAKEHGAMRTGTLKSDPTVTAVSLDAKPATVDIQDCLDTTGYRLVYAKNKRPVPGSGGGRHLSTATATRYPDGRWLINSGTTHRDQPC